MTYSPSSGGLAVDARGKVTVLVTFSPGQAKREGK
jgi:hypothetical protein